MNPRVVDEGIPYGVYIWRVNGKPVVDEDFNYLIAPSRRGDLAAIGRLTRFVNNELGITEGEAWFEEGTRPISQEEWEHQRARQEAGLVPDEFDLANLIDEAKYQQELDRQ